MILRAATIVAALIFWVWAAWRVLPPIAHHFICIIIASWLALAFLFAIAMRHEEVNHGGPFCHYPTPADVDFPMCEFKLRDVSNSEIRLSKPRCADSDFIRLCETVGLTETARRLKQSVRSANSRRVSLEKKYRRQIRTPDYNNSNTRHAVVQHPGRLGLTVENGTVLVGGDGHYWPGPASMAHRAFVKFAKDIKPAAVIMNGDAFDGATVSRHPKIGWEDLPTVEDELHSVQERLGEIEAATFKARKIWTLGNHDGRFETRLATVAPEYARVHGFHLKDHFPHWEPCWSCWINDDVVVKHRYKSGDHAAHNNTIRAGKTIITNHLHSAKVTPYDDYNGTRYGVDTGCLADPHGRQFLDYTEDNPRNHRSGFCVLTFKGGRLMLPELVLVWDQNHVQFRGEVIRV